VPRGRHDGLRRRERLQRSRDLPELRVHRGHAARVPDRPRRVLRSVLRRERRLRCADLRQRHGVRHDLGRRRHLLGRSLHGTQNPTHPRRWLEALAQAAHPAYHGGTAEE
jgi:hypothetical protein